MNAHLFMVEFHEVGRRTHVTELSKGSIRETLRKFRSPENEIQIAFEGLQLAADQETANDHNGWSAHIIYAGY